MQLGDAVYILSENHSPSGNAVYLIVSYGFIIAADDRKACVSINGHVEFAERCDVHADPESVTQWGEAREQHWQAQGNRVVRQSWPELRRTGR